MVIDDRKHLYPKLSDASHGNERIVMGRVVACWNEWLLRSREPEKSLRNSDSLPAGLTLA